MIVLIVISAVILIILLLVNIPVKAVFKFFGAHADITVKLLFFKVYPRKDKRDGKTKPLKKEKRGLRRAENKAPPPGENEKGFPAEKDDPPPEELPFDESSPPENGRTESGGTEEDMPQEEKQSFLERISSALDRLSELSETVSLICELILEPLKKFAGKIRLSDIVIDFAAADEDAATAAVAYGRLCAGVYNAIALVGSYTDITVKSVDIDCLYNTPSYKSRYNGELTLSLRPASLLNAVFAVVFRYLLHKDKYAPVTRLLRDMKK